MEGLHRELQICRRSTAAGQIDATKKGGGGALRGLAGVGVAYGETRGRVQTSLLHIGLLAGHADATLFEALEIALAMSLHSTYSFVTPSTPLS
jgi:hypothetical protein